MRVLHVHQKAGFFGGVERILFDTAQGLAERDWPQALLYVEPDVQANFLSAFDSSGTGADLIERFQPDVVLIHKLEDHQSLEDLARRFPTVRMVHDHDLVCLRRHKYFPTNTQICTKPAGINCYSHLCFVQKSAPGSVLPIAFTTLGKVRAGLKAHNPIRRFIAISHWMRDELLMNGIEDERISLLSPIPRATGDIQPLPPSDEPEILFVGQLIRGKGVDLMVRALGAMQDQLPADTPWHTTIVGAGHHLEQCQSIAEELGLQDRVTFTGWVNHEDLQAFYAKARFTVVPSRWPEPFGMVGVEAMARSRPVVAFAAGGIPDWLKDGETGYLVPPADIEGMAARMADLLQDSDKATQLGENAAIDVRKRFRHDQYLDGMQKILRDVSNADQGVHTEPKNQNGIFNSRE